MGTVGYMSLSRSADSRSTIVPTSSASVQSCMRWLPVIAPLAETPSVETMNAILKEEVPELSGSGVQVSPGLDRIIRSLPRKETGAPLPIGQRSSIRASTLSASPPEYRRLSRPYREQQESLV